jgi:hypothetical protein
MWFEGRWPFDIMPFEGKALYAEKRWRGFESIFNVLRESSSQKDQQDVSLSFAVVGGECEKNCGEMAWATSRGAGWSIYLYLLDAVRVASLVSLVITGSFVWGSVERETKRLRHR